MHNDDVRAFVTVTEAALILGISRSAAYERVKEHFAGRPGGLPAIRLGPRKLLVARAYLDRLAAGPAIEAPITPTDDAA